MILLLVVQTVLMSAPPRIASGLQPGMLLIYASEGRDQPAWTIELVETGLPLKDRADCARLRIRRQPPPAPAPEESRLCVENLVQYGWSAAQSVWLPQRPVGPDMTLDLPRPNGEVVRYATGKVTEEVVGTRRVEVVETTVTTTDASGKPLRRLRERYAVGLATATGGRFEMPDAAAPGGWRDQQVFELREIRVAPSSIAR
jgi:hypothetical protein